MDHCPECGALLRPYEDRTTVGLACTACDSKVVTTNHERPGFDPTRYAVVLDGKMQSRKELAQIAVALGLSASQLGARMRAGQTLVEDVASEEAPRILRRLREVGASAHLSPQPRWTIEDWL